MALKGHFMHLDTSLTGNDKEISDIPSREYCLLREIEAHLQMWQNMQRPLKAQDMLTTISTEKLATLMAWAQVGLREHVIAQNRAMEAGKP